MDLLQFVLSFLGGGVVVAALDWFRTSRSERTARRVEAIRLQLQDLYGPLQFLTHQNAKLFELNNKIHQAYTMEYVEKKWSQAQITQERKRQSATQTLEIANLYVEQVNKNNEQIISLIEQKYSLIDSEDAEVFSQFLVDYLRMRTENDDNGTLKTPYEIYEHLGSISFMRHAFIETVDKRFKEKKSELDKLLK